MHKLERHDVDPLALSERPGRALAWVRSPKVTADQLLALGWWVDDLGPDLLSPVRDFSSLADARAAASADLPRGTAVNWVSADHRLSGGFIVGYDGVAPPLTDLTPAFVKWPDGSFELVDNLEELASALRERLDWLVALELDAGFDADEIAAGRVAALRALSELEASGRFRLECCGPHPRGRFAARVSSVGFLRWEGFRDGWDEPDGPSAAEREHPRDDHPREFQRIWRGGVAEGVNAYRSTHR